MSELAEMVEALADLTEAHVSAAANLNTDEVERLAQRRTDMLFELKICLSGHPPLDAGDRERVQDATQRLARAEHRFERTVGSLLRVLNPPPRSAGVYGRKGQLMEGRRGTA